MISVSQNKMQRFIVGRTGYAYHKRDSLRNCVRFEKIKLIITIHVYTRIVKRAGQR